MDSIVNKQFSEMQDFYLKCVDLILCAYFAKLVRFHCDKKQLKTGIVGVDPNLYNYKEVLYDFKYLLSGYIGGNPKDAFHPSQPFEILQDSIYDVLLNGGYSMDNEQGNLEQLRKFQKSLDASSTKVFRPRMLRESFVRAYSHLLPGSFQSCLNPVKLMIVSLLLSLTPINGEVLECGCYGGGTSILMAMLLSLWNDSRIITAIDTFEGMPDPTPKDGKTIYTRGVLSETSEELVKKRVGINGLSRKIKIQKGLVQNVLPSILENDGKVSFALVDTDQYLGTYASLMEILPRLQTNGIVIVDDYSLEGVQKAIDEVHYHFQDSNAFCITYNFYVLWRFHGIGFMSHLAPRLKEGIYYDQDQFSQIHEQWRLKNFSVADKLAAATVHSPEHEQTAKLYRVITLRLSGKLEAALKTAQDTLGKHQSPELLFEMVQIGNAIGHYSAAIHMSNLLKKNYPQWRPTWQIEFAQSST
jgi:hypothetical protein